MDLSKVLFSIGDNVAEKIQTLGNQSRANSNNSARLGVITFSTWINFIKGATLKVPLTSYSL
jgi:hypothetical protein